MNILSNYLKNKRKEKLCSKLFEISVDSAKFLKDSQTYKESANNMRFLISNCSTIGLHNYLKDYNRKIQDYEAKSSIAYQQYLNAQEKISIIQQELNNIC